MCVIGIDFTWNKIFMRCKQWFHTMDNLNNLCKQAMQHFVTTLRIFNGPGCIKMWHELTLYQLLICHSWIFRSAPVFYTSVWADNQLKAIWAHTPGAKLSNAFTPNMNMMYHAIHSNWSQWDNFIANELLSHSLGYLTPTSILLIDLIILLFLPTNSPLKFT